VFSYKGDRCYLFMRANHYRQYFGNTVPFLPDFMSVTGKFANWPSFKPGLTGLISRLPGKMPAFSD